MSAKLGAMIALKPKSRRAQGACSREEPQPKFAPATSTLAPEYSGRSSTKLPRARQSKNKNGPYPVRSILFKNCLGMIWSVSTSAMSSGAMRRDLLDRLHLHHLPHVDEV